LQAALEAGDRVHLNSALEDAERRQLQTPTLDEARRQLQGSKTGSLVEAIQRCDYVALGRAIAEAESRSPEELAQICDVLAQARAEHARLHAVAGNIADALGSLNHEALRSACADAKRSNVVTDDLRKAEAVLAGIDASTGQLENAVNCSSGDAVALQDALHRARQQGLQYHPLFKRTEELFAVTCVPSGFEWVLKELQDVWVALTLSCSQEAADRAGIQHSVGAVVSEICHKCKLPLDADSYPVQYIQYALARIATRSQNLSTDLKIDKGALTDLTCNVQAALDEFSKQQSADNKIAAVCITQCS